MIKYNIDLLQEINDLIEIIENFELTNKDYLLKYLEFIKKNEKDKNFNIDKHLFKVYSEIRKEIIIENTRNNLLWFSPQKCEFNKKNITSFEYDRGRTTQNLEEKYKVFNKLKSYCVFFNSGMAAFDVLLKLIKVMYKSPRVVQNSYYYENFNLTQNCYTDLNIMYLDSYKKLYDYLELNPADVIITEIVDANTMLSKLDVQKLINLINKSKKRIVSIIIDTTLWCEEIDWSIIANQVNKNCIFYIYRSYLKLDQFGLELVNSGLLEIYGSKNLNIDKIILFLNCAKSWSGNCLGHLEENILMNKCIINNKIKSKYKLEICKNANFIKDILVKNKNLNINIKLRFSPVVIFKIKNFKKEDYINLLNQWENFKREFNCFSYNGTSLGFRYLRIELIQPKEGFAIRISAGYSRNKTFYCLIKFLMESI